ncbi:MAG: 50S ribosomal protein L3, partial [Proteobacteria bacterium]|nr:50S ribosomal protein L3 [Pseudomonadota bacterium]
EKLGMSRVFKEDGSSTPVTIVQVDPNRITQIKNGNGTDGYTAIQVTTGSRRASRVTKSMAGHYAKAQSAPGVGLWEFRLAEEGQAEGLKVGGTLGVSLFETGQKVDVQGTTIGKGFAGAMKRWGFKGLRATHGVSISHRSLGSTGQCQDPGRVFKNKKMAGHMGAAARTQQGLEVVRVDAERNLILVKGSVPGAKGTRVVIKPSVKGGSPIYGETVLTIAEAAVAADAETKAAVADTASVEETQVDETLVTETKTEIVDTVDVDAVPTEAEAAAETEAESKAETETETETETNVADDTGETGKDEGET